MSSIRMGIHLWAQNTDWGSYLAAARRVDQLGYDHLWTWDHLISTMGDPDRPVFEGYTTLAAWAMATRSVRLGLLVGANTFRNPAILAKTVVNLDHISGGRAILGLGSGWHAREHEAFGIDFGTGFGERLDWLEEALCVVRPLIAGEAVDHAGPRYRVDHLRLAPPPVQGRIPVMVGGVGERKTLRSVALHADMWNAQSPLSEAPHKLDVLRAHCADVGRDPATIELTYNTRMVIRDDAAEARRILDAQLVANGLDPATAGGAFWAGTVEQIATRLGEFADLGFRTFIIGQLAPFDAETIDRLVGDVKPLLEGR